MSNRFTRALAAVPFVVLGVVGLTMRAICQAKDKTMQTIESYLGDGLYAKFDGSDLTLYTDRQEAERNVRHYVVLEPKVLTALEMFLARVDSEREKALRQIATDIRKDTGYDE